MQTVGFIGLGAMGWGMADNLHQAGLLTAVWNRTEHKVADFLAQHADMMTSELADFGVGLDVIVLCVSADQDVTAIIDKLMPSLAAGSLVIDCSTVSASTAQHVADQLAQRGVGFIDCPVSGGTEGARRGSLAMMVGGDEKHVALAQPVLTAMGNTIQHMGAVGAGQATKAVNQIMAAGINQAVTDALAFGQAHGLPMEKVIDVVGSGAAGNWFLSHRGQSMLSNQFPLGFKLALHHKDLLICQQMADEVGLKLNSIEHSLSDYAQLMRDGHGDDDISALFLVKAADR